MQSLLFIHTGSFVSSGVCCPGESRSCSVCWSRNGGRNRSRGSCFSLPPRTWRRNYARDGRKYKRWVACAPRSWPWDMQRYIQFLNVCGQTERGNVKRRCMCCFAVWAGAEEEERGSTGCTRVCPCERNPETCSNVFIVTITAKGCLNIPKRWVYTELLIMIQYWFTVAYIWDWKNL